MRDLKSVDEQQRPDTLKAASTPGALRRGDIGTALLCAAVLWFCADSLGLLRMVPLVGKRPESMIYVLLAGAILGATRWRRLPAIGASLLLVLWLVVCFTPLATRLTMPLKTMAPEASLQPGGADAVIVLSADIQSDNEFDSLSLARFLGGMEAIRREFAPILVLTELNPPAGSHRIAAQKLTERLKINCPLETIGPVSNTRDEAVAMAKLAGERGWKKIVLVTSPTHSLRSTLVFQNAGRELGWEVLSFPCRETNYNLEDLSRPKERLQAFAAGIHEVLGINVYRMRGWI